MVKPRYLNRLDTHGEWTSPPRLRAAIETERNRQLSAAELDQFSRTQRRLRAQLAPSWLEDLDAIDRDAAELT